MHASKKHKLLFVHIPKNAGKSIIMALDTQYKDLKKIAWGHARLKDVRYKIPLHKYKIIACVRNPWERMVSLYNFIAQHKKTYKTRRGIVRQAKELKDIGFKKWLIKRGEKTNNLILTDIPQYAWLKGPFNVNCIRFESLANDFKKITNINMKLPVTHKSKHKHYREYYDDETNAYIERVFGYDIKLWGYEF